MTSSLETTSPAGGQAALVFGITGVSGWALLREIALKSGADKFTRVIGVCNEPTQGLKLFVDAVNCEIVSGVDLLGGLDTVTAKLKDISGIYDVTHCFYVGKEENTSLKPKGKLDC